MSFDETYLKGFDIVYRFCFSRNGGNQYLAEEATKKTMDFMAQKWEMVQLFTPKRLEAWLYGVAKLKMKELDREQPHPCESIDLLWCQQLIEQQQLENGEPLDEDTEYRRFLDYAAAVEKELEGWERELFHYRVVEGLLFKDIGKQMHITENAAKLRWYRLEEKLKPIVNKMLILE